MFWTAVENIHECGARRIVPFINGDPLADVRMPDFINEMAKQYPDIDVVLYTNGAIATEEVVAKILGSKNVTHFIFSLQGGTKAVFEDTTGLHWDDVLANIRRTIAIHNKIKSKAVLRLTMCVFSKTIKTLPQFRALCAELGLECCPGVFSNFGGMLHDEIGEAPFKDAPRLVCNRATTHSYIYWNGDVGQCCFDLLGTIIYGNLKTQRLKDIIQSETYQNMLTAHRTLDIDKMPPICQNCNSPRFRG